MNLEELNQNLLSFFETIEKYYGCETEITEGLFNDQQDLDPEFTTWNLSKFDLIRSAYRKKATDLCWKARACIMKFRVSELLPSNNRGGTSMNSLSNTVKAFFG
jgi:hypothetical protein